MPLTVAASPQLPTGYVHKVISAACEASADVSAGVWLSASALLAALSSVFSAGAGAGAGAGSGWLAPVSLPPHAAREHTITQLSANAINLRFFIISPPLI